MKRGQTLPNALAERPTLTEKGWAATEPVVAVFDWCKHGTHLPCPGEGTNQYRRHICSCSCHKRETVA